MRKLGLALGLMNTNRRAWLNCTRFHRATRRHGPPWPRRWVGQFGPRRDPSVAATQRWRVHPTGSRGTAPRVRPW
jgi:hypothetical protein